MLFRSLAVTLTLALTVTTAAGPAAAAPTTLVALGDSSAAGPLIPNQIDTVCLRSDHNWPHALAALLGATLTDVTCSGATIPDLTGRQAGRVPPQFNALRSDTRLVTLAISANDIQLSSAFVNCAASALPAGRTCQQRYGDTFSQRIRQTAPKLAGALTEIHRRSPQARVLVAGYLTYWRSGGCYPADPYRAVDADFIQRTFDQLMTMMASVSDANGATYVDIRQPSRQHGLCEPPATRWLEGANPSSPAYPYHPNAAGMTAAAAIIAPAAR